MGGVHQHHHGAICSIDRQQGIEYNERFGLLQREITLGSLHVAAAVEHQQPALIVDGKVKGCVVGPSTNERYDKLVVKSFNAAPWSATDANLDSKG